jgi:WD40 repeat protein
MEMRVNFLRGVFMSASHDSINLWDLRTYQRVKTLHPRSPNKFINALFSSNSQYLITVLSDGTLNYWDLADFEIKNHFHFDTSLIAFDTLSQSFNGEFLVTGYLSPTPLNTSTYLHTILVNSC